jgi:hypothetical protein
MNILKCARTVSMTALLATELVRPPLLSPPMRCSGTRTARMSVPSLYCRP